MDYGGLFARVELSLARLARLAGMSRNTLLSWKVDPEGGSRNRREPTPESLRQVAGALDQHAAVLGAQARALRAEARRRERRAGRG